MANITIDNLPVNIGLDGTERVPIAKNTGFGFVTEYTTTGSIAVTGTDAEYILAGSSITLPNSRVLTSIGTEVTINDGGSGGNFTLGLANTAVTPGTYGDTTHIVQITVDAKGRITGITNLTAASVITAYLLALPTSLPAQPNTPWNNGGIVSIS